MAEKRAKKTAKQVMDVSKPGKTVPAATSRPVIVGHKPMAQDPMVTAQKPDTPQSTGEAVTVKRSAKTIAPLETPKSDTKASKAEKSPPPPQAAIPDPLPKAEQTKPSEPGTEPTQTNDTAVVDAVAEQAGNKKRTTQVTEADQKRQAELEKLIEEKKYYVPIGQTTHRRHTRWALILLLLVLCLAAGVYAIDAELLDIGIELPFDVIRL